MSCFFTFFHICSLLLYDGGCYIQHYDVIIIGDPSQSTLQAYNAPLVSFKDKKSGRSLDYNSYLANFGNVDIFFPTDFACLKEMRVQTMSSHYERLEETVRCMKGKQFLVKYGDFALTKTFSGYNPLLEDFENTSFLVQPPVSLPTVDDC